MNAVQLIIVTEQIEIVQLSFLFVRQFDIGLAGEISLQSAVNLPAQPIIS